MTQEERDHYAEIAKKVGPDKPLAVFDLETTGGDVSHDQIVEVYVRCLGTDGSDQGVLHQRVKPDFEPKKAAVEKHGLTMEDLEGCPKFAELDHDNSEQTVADKVAEYLDGYDLVGFNIEPFDIPILCEEFSRNGMSELFDPHDHRVIDPYKIILAVEKRDLFSMYKRFVERDFENPHSAGADVEATIELLGAMIDHFDVIPEGDVDQLDRFSRGDMRKVDVAGKFVVDPESGDIVFNFGKHRYVDVGTVYKQDRNYFDWMVYRGDFHSDTRRVAEAIRGKLDAKEENGEL